jgi:CheY-like chemotaxis protein
VQIGLHTALRRLRGRKRDKVLAVRRQVVHVQHVRRCDPGFAPQLFLEEAKLDCQIWVMRNGQQVIEMIESLESGGAQEMPDLILLDLNLPNVTGDAVLERAVPVPAAARPRSSSSALQMPWPTASGP